ELPLELRGALLEGLLAQAVGGVELPAGLGELLLVGPGELALLVDEGGLGIRLALAAGLLERALALGEGELELAPARLQLALARPLPVHALLVEGLALGLEPGRLASAQGLLQLGLAPDPGLLHARLGARELGQALVGRLLELELPLAALLEE